MGTESHRAEKGESHSAEKNLQEGPLVSSGFANARKSFQLQGLAAAAAGFPLNPAVAAARQLQWLFFFIFVRQ